MLLKNISHQTVAAISNGFLLILLILAGRILGNEEFGKFSLALAIAFIFDAILDPGFYQIAIRDVARKHALAKQYLSAIFGYKLAVGTAGILILSYTIYHGELPIDTGLVILIMVFAGVLKSLKTTFSSIFHGFEYFKLDAFVWSVERFALLFFGALGLFWGIGLVGFCVVFAGVRLLDLIFVSILTRVKLFKFSVSLSFPLLKRLLANALPVGLFLIVLNLYSYVDTIMISIMRGDAEVGWYNAAFKLYEGVAVFPMILCNVFRPQIAKSYKKNRAYFEELFPRGIKYVVIIALFVGTTGYLGSEIFIRALFGEQYLPSAVALRILLSGILFVFGATYFQIMLIAMDRQKMVLYVAIVGLLFNVTLNLILIPQFGYIGASVATITGEALVCILLFYYLITVGVQIPLLETLVKPSILMIAPLIFLHYLPLLNHVLLELVLINVAFSAFLWLFKVLKIREFKNIGAEPE